MSGYDLPDPLPRRLNVGCGWDIRTGFLNVDAAPFHKPDLMADITNLPMLPSDYFVEIVAQDVLEHFERSKTVTALLEWSRLLSPDGSLFIRTPSLLHMMDLLTSCEVQGSPGEAAKIIHLIYGTQAYEGDYHLAGFTALTLQASLKAANLYASSVGLRDGWLFDIHATKFQLASPVAWPVSRAENDRVANDRLANEVAALRTSTSWRITTPVRLLKHATTQGSLSRLRHLRRH